MIIHEHDGELTINARRDGVDIIVTDKRSGVYAMSVTCDTAEFLAAIARSSNVACKFWIDTSGRVGSDSEVKTVNVPFNMYGKGRHPKDTDPVGYRTPATVKALAPFEVDGWRGEERDMWNGHNCVRERGIDGDTHYQKVRFFRFVRDGKPI